MSLEEVAASEAKCMALIPQADEAPWVLEQAYGEDAAAALAYALRARRTEDSQEAAWAARRACDALDYFVINHDDIDTNVAGAEARVDSHPLVQAELRRQADDLEDLVGAGGDVGELIARLRVRAKEDAPTFFGSAS